ncbi:MAG TPA: phosphotransferase [Actinospica sp.]|nr:phosphotransferase [Actinospica sp.]
MTDAPAAVATTHRIEFDGERVVKTYNSWARGEPLREWRGLTLLHEYAPGLGPAPIAARLDLEPPSIVMSRVPGESLGTRPVTPDQLDALAEALQQLHASVPEKRLADVEPQNDPASFDELLHRAFAARAHAASETEPMVRRAVAAARAFLDSGWVGRCAGIGEPSPVFAMNDGNLANYLWDGACVRVVDLESAGRLDRAFDLSDFVEHISARAHAGIRAQELLGRLGLRPDECARIRAYRPAFAVFWLLRLLPGGGAARRNPPGTLAAQAAHLLALPAAD